MKLSSTHAERLQGADWILDARQLLVGVTDLERHIATVLGVAAEEEAITDAIAVPTCTVDDVLETLGIAVSEDVN